MRVLYPGGFDLLHQGHLNALTVAHEMAGPNGELTVAINSNEFMAHYKRIPMRDQAQRMRDVQATGLAHNVILWHGPAGQDAQILNHHPDVYVASMDWINRDLASQLGIPDLTWFDDNRISLLYVRRTPGISTTQLIEQSGHQ